MYALSCLFLCALLQAGFETATPQSAERLPAVPSQPFVPAAPVQIVPPAVPSHAPSEAIPQPTPPTQQSIANPQTLFFPKGGLLELPERNKLTLSAPERAVLASLQTEQRNAEGNPLTDETGNPAMIPLREGMYVFKGQVLGNFDDRELHSMLKINEAQLEVALAEQKKKTEVIYAAESLRLAIHEHQTLVAANSRVDKTVGTMEIQRAALAKEQAQANLDLQKYNLEEVKTREVVVRRNEMARTEVQIEQRKLIAPIDGIIVAIKAAEGEWIREGDPVLEIVQLDTLQVKVSVDVRRYEARDLDGKQAAISVPLANGQTEVFQGTVVFCDPRVDAGYTFNAYIEVQNRKENNYWLLQPGRGDVDIEIMLH